MYNKFLDLIFSHFQVFDRDFLSFTLVLAISQLQAQSLIMQQN